MKRILLLFIISCIALSVFSMESDKNKEEIFKAIERNDIAKVQQLINNGLNITVKQVYNKKRVSPITFAIAHGNDEMINILMGSLDSNLRNPTNLLKKRITSKL